jgi:hypothetical protein
MGNIWSSSNTFIPTNPTPVNVGRIMRPKTASESRPYPQEEESNKNIKYRIKTALPPSVQGRRPSANSNGSHNYFGFSVKNAIIKKLTIHDLEETQVRSTAH